MRLRLGIFGRTYGLMLAAVLGAEVLIFSAMIFTAPPLPPIVEFTRLVELLDGRAAGPAALRLQITRAASPPPQDDSPASLALAGALADSLGLPGEDIRANVGQIGPRSPFGPQPVENVALGGRPMVVAGDLAAARRMPDGRWLVVRSDASFLRAASLHIGLLLLGTLALVLPAAYLLARHSTRHVRRFAEAAERLGRDPHAPPLKEAGAEEIRVASEAFNLMQRRLTTYIEERTTMVAAVAHDLRTPLMRMAFEIEDAPEPLQQRLQAQIREMREMTDALMRFLRAEQSRHQREPVELDALLQEVVDGLRAEGGDVEIGVPGDEILLIGDRVGLKSVFRNIVGNAVTYGRSATIALRACEHKAVVTIRDRGPGLSEDDLRRVFQPFYRVEKSRNRATGGIGLGLAIARSIIVAHGGNIALSNLPAGGLEAKVTLPLAASAS